jgi:PKD repeat protein
MKRLSIFTVLLTLLLGLSQTGLTQTAQGIIVVPPSDQIQVTINVDRQNPIYAVGEQIRLFIQTTAPSASHVYLNVVDIDAAGRCTLIFPNAFSPNPLVPVGPFVLPDRTTYRFQVTPPAGTEFVQAFASLQPLDLRQIFNTPSGDPFPALCTNPSQFAQQVQAAVQGIIAVGQFATAFTSFTVLATQPPPPPPPTNRPPVAQFAVSTNTPLVGQTVQFTSTSFDPDAGDFITQYFWNFGDGFTATGPIAFHAYPAPGIFQATLTVFDSRGASSSASQSIFVTSVLPPPPPPVFPQPGFYVTAVDSTHIRISVVGSPAWFTDRAFRIALSADGLFTRVEQQQISGNNVVSQGLVPVPVGNQLELTGTVRNGRIDYLIGFTSNTSKIKFDLRLDLDGDGTLERQRSFVFLGSQRINPPSNPFVVTFPARTICLVIIDVPGFQFIACGSFSTL